MDDINKSIKEAKKNVESFTKDSKTLSNDLKKAFDGVGDKISSEFKKAKNNINSILKEIGNITTDSTKNLNNSWASSLDKLINEVKSKLDKIKNIYQSHNSDINNATDKLVSSVSNKVSKLSESYTKSFNNIKSNIDKTMDSSYNKVNTQLNNIKRLFDNFNATLKVKIPHFYMYGEFNAETKEVPKVGVNYFAKGGIVDRATLGVFGEAGKEAIVPLQNNTEWMDTLKGIMGSAFIQAMKTNNGNSNNNIGDGDIILQIDSSVIGKVALKQLRKMQRQGNVTLIPT